MLFIIAWKYLTLKHRMIPQ